MAAPVVLPPAHSLEPRRDWFTKPCMMGIDEAGRGPVLGPMVYACVVAPCDYMEQLANKAYADSKTLTHAQRASLFAAVQGDGQLAYAYDSLSAAFISGQMLARAKVSLNAVAADSTMGLIRQAIEAGVRLREVYVDTVGDADRYKQKLQRAFPDLSFTVCPKADALFPVVSAASIVAKVTRDTAILVAEQQLAQQQQQQQEAGAAGGVAAAAPGDAAPPAAAEAPAEAPVVVLGTGYPGDSATQAWLSSNLDPVFGFPPLVRFSWDTVTRMLEEKGVPVRWESEGQGGQQQSQPALTAFIPGGDACSESSGAGRHAFFKIRRMQRMKAF